jgi:hypothetical protein
MSTRWRRQEPVQMAGLAFMGRSHLLQVRAALTRVRD